MMFNNEFTHSFVDDNAVKKIFSRVFAWMFLGMAVTALSAFALINTSLIELVFSNPFVWIALVIAELALVAVLSAALNKLSVTAARLMFIVYSALNGVTISCIFLIYTGTSIFLTFLMTSMVFLLMAVVGFTTKIDLSRFSSLFTFGLIGIIITSLLNVFLFKSTPLDTLISVIAIILFLGITAYDIQKIKNYAYSMPPDAEINDVVHKTALFGALMLYLDFINLFLRLLRIFGKRR